jgi:hypothetical protein
MAETATEVREQAQEKAQEAASRATDQARSQVDQRTTDMGGRVSSTAGDIRSVGEQLREQGKDQPARLADQAAGHVERAGNWLRESDSDKLLRDIEDFGRRQPLVFALGGLALGIAASRFLKASSTQRAEARRVQDSSHEFVAQGTPDGLSTMPPASFAPPTASERYDS